MEQLYPRIAIEQVTTPVIVRTNHFCNLLIEDSIQGDLNNSYARYNRMKSLLGDGQNFSLGSIQSSLSDHHAPDPICSHTGELRTVSAAIYDLRSASLYYSAGPPCSTAWINHATR
jgi:hypothetical protein